jgi:hypothetical protein
MKLKSILVVAASSLVLASCLKSKGLVEKLNSDSGSIVTEIWDVNYYGDVKAISVETTPATEQVALVTLKFYAPKSNKPAGDITAHLVRNDAIALAQGLVIPPSNGISVPNAIDVVIPKATGEATLTVTVNKNNLDLTKTYGLGFDLQSVSEGVVSQLAKEIVVQIGLKNAYDGIYSGKGYTLRAGDNVLTGNFSGYTVGLVTAGVYVNDFDRAQVWGDGQTGVAIGNPRVTVDPTTNNVTITSSGGASNYPGYPSRYDPTTKTFYLGFTWGAGPSSRAAFDTLKYTGPR